MPMLTWTSEPIRRILEQELRRPDNIEDAVRQAVDFVAAMDVRHFYRGGDPEDVDRCIRKALAKWNLLYLPIEDRQSVPRVCLVGLENPQDHAYNCARILTDVESGRSAILPPRVHALKKHLKQRAYLRSTARFNVVPAGRRSGKTEAAKRRAIKIAYLTNWHGTRVVFGAPTHGQAKKVFWEDIKAMVPEHHREPGSLSESALRFKLKHNGVELQIVSLDKAFRTEGSPIAHFVGDEWGNVKEEVWTQNMRPALMDPNNPPGTADLIGVPEGRNHYYDRYCEALEDETGQWAAFHWSSEEILSPLEIEAIRKDLDPLTFDQEIRASFVNFAGRAYYNFTDENVVEGLHRLYDPTADLIVMMDFNSSPGTASVGQEIQGRGTCIFDEIFIHKNSNTEMVTKMLLERYGGHRGQVYLYGDATGGAQGSAKVSGSDWDIAYKLVMKPHFRDRVWLRVPDANPSQRVRVNSMRCRICTVDGKRHLFVDKRCKYTIRDYEGTVLDENGSGEIAKGGDKNKNLTHLTDGQGYYVAKKFPILGDFQATTSERYA